MRRNRDYQEKVLTKLSWGRKLSSLESTIWRYALKVGEITEKIGIPIDIIADENRGLFPIYIKNRREDIKRITELFDVPVNRDVIQEIDGKWWKRFWEHSVFRVGEYFYKQRSFLGKRIMTQTDNACQEAKESYERIASAFWDICEIIPIEIKEIWDDNYMIQQKAFEWEPLSLKHLQGNSQLQHTLAQILEINKKLWQEEWIYLDLLGSDFIFNRSVIHNLFTDGEKIYIFDFGLLKNTSKTMSWFRFLQSRALDAMLHNI